MVLIRHVLASKKLLREAKQDLMKSHWPGGAEAPESRRVVCRAVTEVEDRGDFVLLQCVYEG